MYTLPNILGVGQLKANPQVPGLIPVKLAIRVKPHLLSSIHRSESICKAQHFLTSGGKIKADRRK